MSSTPTYTEAVLELGQKKTNRLIEKCCYESALQFKKILRSYVWFHVSFFLCISLETIAFFSFIIYSAGSFFIPIALASIFLTAFSYFVLIYYFQAKKPDQFAHIKNSFFDLCRQTFERNPSASDYHLSLAGAFEKLASFLEKHFTEPLQSRLFKQTHFFIKKDVLSMQEMLIFESIKEHITLIKKEPTDFEAHASLALTYLNLAKIYKPKSLTEEKNETYISSIERGIEEFKILRDYLSTDPWVHAQLASCYHDLDMKKEEIKEYEMILHLRPDDKEIMHRLGILYFQQGQNAKGLKIYEQLRSFGYKKADQLLQYYDAYTKSIFPKSFS